MAYKYKLIRVTSVLSFVESAWKEYWWRKVGFEAADKIGKESAEFGTQVHELVGKFLIGGFDCTREPEDPVVQCAERIISWIDENQVTPLFDTWTASLEVEVKDEKLGLIGHFDLAALVDGVPTIVDFKTSNKMRKSFPLQKAAYAKMTNKQLGVKIDNGVTIRSHWDKEEQKVEFEVKVYPNLLKTYWPLFKSCLTLYKYFTRA